MRTVREAWASYRVKVMPPDAGAVQLQECRRAFYAGAQALLEGIMGGLSEGPESSGQDERWLQSLHQELDRFGRDVKEGRA